MISLYYNFAFSAHRAKFELKYQKLARGFPFGNLSGSELKIRERREKMAGARDSWSWAAFFRI
jgi:hypothetical protein